MVEAHFITLIILLFLSAFFAGTETALMSLNQIKVRALVRQNKRGSEALHRLKQDPHRLIITILIGNNLVNIGAASLATVVFTNLFGSTGVGIATGVMTFLILVFGEITPKTFASQNAERISLTVARPIELLAIALFPVIKFFEIISRGMNHLLGSKEEKELSEEELKAMFLMSTQAGILSRDAAEMMHNILSFEGTRVTKIMTLKGNIDMVESKAKLKDVLNFVVRSPYSRFPVYGKNKDDIVGILDVDDVLRCVKNKRLQARISMIARKPFFVPDSKEIADLLAEFEGKKIPMAIVVDEYGNVDGLVTVEDILEEIVGDIFNKSKHLSVHMRKVNDKLIRVDAKASVEEINKVLHLGLKSGHFDTIAGFVQQRLQRIPKKGALVKLKNVVIEVDKVTKQGIKSVKILRNEPFKK